jgi:hypothetical protein
MRVKIVGISGEGSRGVIALITARTGPGGRSNGAEVTVRDSRATLSGAQVMKLPCVWWGRA